MQVHHSGHAFTVVEHGHRHDAGCLHAIRDGALENLVGIEPASINATITLLRENGRNEQANTLVNAYVAAQPDEARFFDLQNHHFMADNPIDPMLEAAFLEKQVAFVDHRDPFSVLSSIAEGDGWNEADEKLLSCLSPKGFQDIFEKAEGDNLRRMIKSSLRMASQEGSGMHNSLHEALANIAKKSPLRARRLRHWGFRLPTG